MKLEKMKLLPAAISLAMVGINPSMAGIKFSSDDGNFSTVLGGRIQVDAWSAAKDDFDGLKGKSGTEFRRSRVFVKGTMYDDWIYKGQYDFADNTTRMKDVYIGYNGLDAFKIKIGQFKQSMGLEELTSSKYITFMERALPSEAFATSRRIGLGIYKHSPHLSWAASVYGQNEGDNTNDGGSEGYGAGARLAWTPWNDKGKLLHLGVSGAYELQNDSKLRIRSRMEAHGVDTRYLDSGDIPKPDSTTKLGLEAATILGPFSLQGEYFLTKVKSDAQGVSDPDFDGYYIYGSWFLTGESRKYKKGAFARVTPKSIVGRGGLGAWELAVRYSTVSLDDSGFKGGEESNITVGLNWYATKHVRFMANYIYVNADPIATKTTGGVGNADDNPSIYQMRAQVDF
ncbi:Phosphate/pyrophosphate-specific outer membrane porin OprP/OprO [hydrothermal vent metagenome]|uniref:Phosphate/pyrophosphate-specific outer membrane porin OprP/OprO n=1 Tax=hydrothermal vent metagenome TaxID=652676 RepID=A0A3B0ZAN4_9ZZZZ